MECLFLGGRWKLDASESVMVTCNEETMEAAIPVTQCRSEGLSLCLPTFHKFDIENSHVVEWLEKIPRVL